MKMFKICLLITNILDSTIELYIFLQQSQIIDQPISNKSESEYSDEAEEKVDVVIEEKEIETQDDNLLNTEDDDQQTPLPPSQVYSPPQHMTNLNLHGDKPSYDILYNLYMWSEGELKVGDKFHTKEDYVQASKKFHMDNFVDFNVHRTDMIRYVIHFRNVL